MHYSGRTIDIGWERVRVVIRYGPLDPLLAFSVALAIISDIVPDSTFSLLVHDEFRQTNNLKPNCVSNHPLLMLAKSINPCKSLSFFLNFFFKSNLQRVSHFE